MSTEEDIKIKVIIPFLKSVGFDESELEFEKSFSIRLGTYTARIDTNKQIEKASPRLDILVKRNEENLFIIEAKTDSHGINDDDIEQAICYARLVHPMAPLAIVTNGRESKVYNTITKEPVYNKDIKGYRADLSDIEKTYEEAFKSFITCSEENIRIFCKEQLNEHMKTLLGSHENPGRKFIPDLYVQSKKLDKKFVNFLESDKPVFALVGESGVGKTCAMCGLARDYLENQQYPVFFYKAQELIGTLIKAISDDFHWEFSSFKDDISLLKRLGSLFKNTKIIIFIDGVDEWIDPQKVNILGDFASKIKNKNFKLVISCKSGQWPNFLSVSGTPTGLSQEIFPDEQNVLGYSIGPFDGEEFSDLVKKYRAFYKFEGLFESTVLDECKQMPFLLRVFFEVAYMTNSPHLHFSTLEFFEEYYKSIIEKLPGNDTEKRNAERVIKLVAKNLFVENFETISENSLREALSFGTNDELPLSVFDHNILERTYDNDKSESKIGFYFKKIRDYIIAFKVNKWNKLSIEDFKLKVEDLSLCTVQLDALSLFYRLADIEHKRVIDEPLRTNAGFYLKLYTDILGAHFYNLKHRFSPNTKGEIGFLGDFSIEEKMVRYHGFRSINEGEEEINFLPVEGRNHDDNLYYLEGGVASHWSSSSDGFNNINIKEEVLQNEIISQLKKIIEKGKLNEENNYYLALEKALGIVVEHQKHIHNIKDTHSLSQYLPIDIEKVEYGIRYEQAYHYYDNQLQKKKIEDGIVKPTWSGSTRSCHYSNSKEDRQLINKQAEEAALSKIELADEVTYVGMNKLTSILQEALSTIKNRNIYIDESLLPDRDAIPTGDNKYEWDYYKETTLTLFLYRIYKLYLKEYKTLVETNFPTLKEHLLLYSKMPVCCFLIPDLTEKQNSRSRGMKIYVCKDMELRENVVILCRKDEITEMSNNDRLLKYKQKNYTILWCELISLANFFSPAHSYLDINVPAEFTALRSSVYGQIKQDVSKIEEDLFQKLLLPIQN